MESLQELERSYFASVKAHPGLEGKCIECFGPVDSAQEIPLCAACDNEAFWVKFRRKPKEA